MPVHLISKMHQTPVHQAIIKRLTKRRVPSSLLVELTLSKDPVAIRLARERLETIHPAFLKRVSTEHLEEMNTVFEGLSSVVCQTLAKRYFNQKSVKKLEEMVRYGEGDNFIEARKRLLLLYAQQGSIGREQFETFVKKLGPIDSNPHAFWFLQKGPQFFRGKATSTKSDQELLKVLVGKKFEKSPKVRGHQFNFKMAHQKELEHVSRLLERKFGQKYIGLVIVGSLSKGYSTKKSDVDYFVIATDPRILRDFERYALQQKLKLCWHPSTPRPARFISPQSLKQLSTLTDRITFDRASAFFHGTFLGDAQRFRTLQQQLFNQMNEGKWNELREFIQRHEMSLDKGFIREGIQNFRDQTRLKVKSIGNIPPNFTTMTRLFDKKK